MKLAFLHPLYERPGPWASVYADTSSHRESTSEERALASRAATRGLTDQGADEATCRAVANALDDLRHSSEPYGRAMFAAGGEIVLDPPLAAPPPGTTALWSMLPHTAPLLDLAGEDPLCLVVYLDRRGADFELRGAAYGSEDVGSVTGRQWPLHRTSVRDWSERHFQLKVENTWEHNAGEIAGATAAHLEETQADLVILIGDDRERRAVHDRLSKQVQAIAVEAGHGAGSRLLDEEVERIRAQHVHERAAQDLERFMAARNPDEEGHVGAVEGVPALVDAAREHRIEELLVDPHGPDAHREVWVGPDPDQLAVRRTQTQPLGETRPSPARADDALIRSVAMTDADALSVTAAGPHDAPSGGLGALLRWA